MVWWKGPLRIKFSETVIGFLALATLMLGGWVLHWMVTGVAIRSAQVLTISGNSAEPTAMETYGVLAWQFLAEQSYWMIGSTLTLAMFACIHVVVVNLATWRRSNRNGYDLLECISGTWVLAGLLGATMFFTLAVMWAGL